MSKDIIGGEYKIDLEHATFTATEEAMPLFANGRMALRYILKHVFPGRAARVLVPDHICGSVPDTIKAAGMEMDFYVIGEDFLPEEDTLSAGIIKADAVLLVNYFGMLPKDVMVQFIRNIRKIKNDIIIILDDVQNYAGLYDELGQDYTFTSYRKWFPVPDGACVIWRNGETYQTLSLQSEEDSTIQPLFSKYKYAGNVLKNYRDIVGDEICLKLLQKGEEILENEETWRAMAWTERTMMKMDIRGFLERRKENARILHQGLEAMGIRHLYQEDATPLFVPVLLHKNRDKVRKAMFQQSVFCPIHWNEEWKMAHKGAEPNRLAEMELSLICDHRYGEKEMQRQLEILRNECAYR